MQRRQKAVLAMLAFLLMLSLYKTFESKLETARYDGKCDYISESTAATRKKVFEASTKDCIDQMSLLLKDSPTPQEFCAKAIEERVMPQVDSYISDLKSDAGCIK